MLTLIARRLVSLIATLITVSALIFLVMEVLPGDPAAVMLGTSAEADTLAALRHSLGLDQPLLIRYAAWVIGVLHGDFGQSYTYGVPVAGLIAERLPVTLPLAVLATVLSVAAGVPLGVAAAARRGGLVDTLAAGLARTGIAVPSFWAALLLILVFSSRLSWMPAGGFPGWTAGAWPALKALILPSVALALPQAGILTSVTRTAVIESLGEDFVRTARAKGLTGSAALWRHAVPNALVPIVTLLGLQVTFQIAGAVLVEQVFNLPGLGRLAYQALSQRDLIVLQDVVLLFSAAVIIVNFLVDLSYLALDPRLRDAKVAAR